MFMLKNIFVLQRGHYYIWTSVKRTIKENVAQR